MLDELTRMPFLVPCIDFLDEESDDVRGRFSEVGEISI